MCVWNFVSNSKFIVFLLKHMKGVSPDADTDEAIRDTVAKTSPTLDTDINVPLS